MHHARASRQDPPEILAIIPARGGSKGIPKKNIRPLHDKPLIEYSIDAAKGSKFLTRIVVSTDNDEIAAISRENTVDVIIRPEEIARDASSVVDAIIHATSVLKERDNFLPGVIVLLQPTSPMRNAGDIDNAIRLFLEHRCDSVISVCETDHSPYWCFTLNQQKVIPLFSKEISRKRRQDLPKTYQPNGAIYVGTLDFIIKNAGFVSDNTLAYIMPKTRSIDIDTPLDLALAEFLMAEPNNLQ